MVVRLRGIESGPSGETGIRVAADAGDVEVDNALRGWRRSDERE